MSIMSISRQSSRESVQQAAAADIRAARMVTDLLGTDSLESGDRDNASLGLGLRSHSSASSPRHSLEMSSPHSRGARSETSLQETLAAFDPHTFNQQNEKARNILSKRAELDQKREFRNMIHKLKHSFSDLAAMHKLHDSVPTENKHIS